MLTAAKWRLVAANLLYAVVLLAVGILPGIPAVGAPDHTAHALAYGLQGVLLYVLLLPLLGRGLAALLAAAGTIAYGSLIEVLQLAQSARTFEAVDLAANAIGAVVAVSVACALTGLTKSGADR